MTFIRIILLIPKVERPGLEPGLRDYQSRLLTVWRIAQYIHVTFEKSKFGIILARFEVSLLYNNEFVGLPRFELRPSASKADVLTVTQHSPM